MDGVTDMAEAEKKTGLALLREPFSANQISKLPKPTKRQTDEVKADFKKGIRCKVCGGWHHPQVVHLDYVGHAALTDRLLDCDESWNWEPVAFDERGAPAMDANGGMWIRLTVCGQTRLGYGHADGKKGGDAIKEVIGDALRNAAMRFGAALDLWHKGDLHAIDDSDPATDDTPPADTPTAPTQADVNTATKALADAGTLDALRTAWSGIPKEVQHVPAVIKAKDARKAELDQPSNHQPAGPDLGDNRAAH